MRNVLVHAYFQVDQDVVWDVVTNEVPVLKAEAERLLTKLEDQTLDDENEQE